MPLQTTKNIWHNGKLIPWEERQHPHHVARRPLRLLHLRRHPLLHAGRPVALPESFACRTHAALPRLRPHLPHAARLHRRGAEPGRYRRGRGQRRRSLLHPPRRLPRLRREPASTRSSARSRSTSPTSRGASMSPATRARTSASPAGTAARPTPLPTLAKAGGNYLNSQLIRMEAEVNGYDEGIALDVNGTISEGSGENLFLVRGGVLYTTPLTSAVLNGITRASIHHHAGEGPRHRGRRTGACHASCSTSATRPSSPAPPRRSPTSASVDRITHRRRAAMGPVTRALHDEFFGIVNGTIKDRHNWLTPVKVRVEEPVSA